jgi:shikimate kinase
MKKHLLLIGFSCTGKTSLGKQVFGDGFIIDSDIEVLKWIENETGESFAHIYEVYMNRERDSAIALIE